MIAKIIKYERIALSILLGIPFIFGGVKHFTNFPRSYTWSEFVINYQGGLVRRGLLGEIAYQLNWIIQSRYVLSIFPVVCYLSIIWFLVHREKKLGFNALIFLLSPATILFPVYDFEAFARKDVFILSAFMLCIYLSERIRSKNLMMPLVLFIYGVAGLVVETAWFYLPVACAVVILNEKDTRNDNQVGYWMLSFFFLISCFVVISLINAHHISKTAIIDSWRLLYPTYQWHWDGKGAIGLLGLTLTDGLLITFYSICHITTFAGYVCSLLLASIPTVYTLNNYKLRRFGEISKLGIAWSIAVMCCSFLFAADWGRCIYLFTIHSYLFLITIIDVPDQSNDRVKKVQKNHNYTVLKALFLLVYATSWQVQHWITGGLSALRPGILFAMVRKFSTFILL